MVRMANKRDVINVLQRSEIQRPYIKPPPNKTVCCIPDSSGNNRRGGGGPSCSSSCGPGPTTASHQSNQPKNSSSVAGSISSWGLSWSRGNKSPPSLHNRHHRQQHQQHVQSSTCHPFSSSSSCDGITVKPPKSSSSLVPVGVISSFLAGVITPSSEKGAGSQQFKDSSRIISSVKSITQMDGLYNPDLANFRCLSERKPVNNSRTSPIHNVNSSVCGSGATTRQIGDAVLNANNSRTLQYDDGSGSSPQNITAQPVKNSRSSNSSISATHQFPDSYSCSSTHDFAILINPDDDKQRRKKLDRKSRHHQKDRQRLQPALSSFEAEADNTSEGYGVNDNKNINMYRHNHDTDDELPHRNPQYHDYESNCNSSWTTFESPSSSMTDCQQLLQHPPTQPKDDGNSTLSSSGEVSVKEENGQNEHYYYSTSELEPPTTDHQLTANKYCTTAIGVKTAPEISASIEEPIQHVNAIRNGECPLK